MSWLSTTPVVLVAVGWVLVPGLATTYALGLRSVTAWGSAPLIGIGTLAVSAVVAPRLGLSWSPLTALGAAALVALLILLVRLGSRRVSNAGAPERGAGAEHGPAIAAGIGMAVAVAVGVATGVRGMLTPSTLSQTYDAVFHYNAVAEILASGNGSSLTIGTLTSPGATTAFYPAAWHDLVSLVAMLSGATVPVATNITAIVVAAVVWPLSCLVLVRQLLGRSVVAALLTPPVAVAFVAFPWSLMTYGVLWPNLIGLALVPAALAVVVTFTGHVVDSAIRTGQAVVIAVFAVVGLALAHPNTLFSLAVIGVVPIAFWFVGLLRDLIVAGRWILAGALAVVVGAIGVAGLAFMLTSPLLADVRAFDWPAYQTPPQAIGEVLLNATNHREAAWTISLVVIVGMVAAAQQMSTRWLLPAHLVSGMLFMLASSLESVLAATLTGIWYNDSFRLAAMIPITGVPLAVVGLIGVGTWAAAALPDVRAFQPAVLGVVAAVLLTVFSSGLYIRDHADLFRESYAPPAKDGLVTPQRRAFLEEVGGIVPPGVVVAQNPWSGSALLPPLTGTRVLFPALVGAWTDDQLYLAEHLRDAATDPQVCTVARRLNVEYMLVAEVRFWRDDRRAKQFPGIAVPQEGFERVAQSGGDELYRLTVCGRTTS
ncbi:DUF6541 family protein [Actinomycetes bacterium KLBMP 9759]